MLARNAVRDSHPLNVCAFCGPTVADLTKEHVWPVWVSKALKAVMVGNTVRHQRYEGYTVVKEWTAGQIDLQVKDLCDSCNRIWLGDFEGNVVKPLLEGVISHGVSARFTLIEQSTVAAWACKMATVYEFANRDKPMFFTALSLSTIRLINAAPAHCLARRRPTGRRHRMARVVPTETPMALRLARVFRHGLPHRSGPRDLSSTNPVRFDSPPAPLA